MSRYAIIVAALVLAGCAMTPEQASKRSSYALCEILVMGPTFDQEIAAKILAARSYDCRQDLPLITAKAQARAAANAALLQGLLGASAIINASQPQAVQQPYPQTIIIEQGYQPPPVNIRPPCTVSSLYCR